MRLRPCIFLPKSTAKEIQGLGPNFRSPAALPEKFTDIPIDAPAPISSYKTDFLFAYDVFPWFLMRAESEWIKERRPMRIGDTILQRAVLPPIGFGFCMEFAVRISNIFNEPAKQGFAYETLDGHLERGISEFYFEERGGNLFFVIHTFSEAGHWLSRLGGQFTLSYQKWCTTRALRHVKKRFYQENPNIRFKT